MTNIHNLKLFERSNLKPFCFKPDRAQPPGISVILIPMLKENLDIVKMGEE